jgi:transposase-like protein
LSVHKQREGGTDVVAIDRVSLLDLLRKAGMDGDVDFLRESVEVLAQAVIELEASERVGADKQVKSQFVCKIGSPGHATTVTFLV